MLVDICSRKTLEPVGTIEIVDGKARFLQGSEDLRECVRQSLANGVFCSTSTRVETSDEIVVTSGLRQVKPSEPEFLTHLNSTLLNFGFCTAGVAAALRRFS